MRMISYAQNQEDVLLDRAFPRGRKGLYIDIGAYDPTLNSVTRHFYDLGWRGINVEPAEEAYDKLARARPRDVNLNLGVAETEGTLSFFKSPPESGWSTFSEEIANHHRSGGLELEEFKVDVTTLSRICEEHVGEQTIDFISIDVEGFERQVIEGGNWERWRPRVVLIESTEPGKTVPTHQQWEQLLLDSGYLFAAFDGLNRYYVRREDEDLLPAFEAPANILDDYVVYHHLKAMEDLNGLIARQERHLAASRAVAESLRAELANLPLELGQLHTKYEWMERSIASIKAECEQLRGVALAEAQAGHEELQRLLGASTAELQEVRNLLGGIGPTGVAVARRLAGLAARFPTLSRVAKRVLRLALRIKRALL